MTFKTFSLFLFCVSGLVACNNGGSTNAAVPSSCTANTGNYCATYDMNDNGCDTGQQTFFSQTDYCNGLQNNTLNHGCAVNQRTQDYNKYCTGNTITSTDVGDHGHNHDHGDGDHGDDGGRKKGRHDHFNFDQNSGYSYGLSEDGGCTTGDHDFKSQDELCRGLQDEDLNQSCALDLRQQYYNQKCSSN